MKFKINRFPIYGLSIKTGKIEKFSKKEDALKFFEGKHEDKKSIPIRHKKPQTPPVYVGYPLDNSSDSVSNIPISESE
ncbi:hypothetical protein HOF92_16415 [bacterium]|jgi:hypothetical protein|nr:hypothetical protein [bacterium]